MPSTAQQIGHVTHIQHPLVRVSGLSHAQLDEVVTFTDGSSGQVFSLAAEHCTVVMFTDKPPQIGSTVERTGKLLSCTGLTNHSIVYPTQSLVEHSPDKATQPTDHPPVALTERRRITQPLQTGVSLVDLLLPLGAGQRQLIAGDHKTGKTLFTLQTARFQATQDTHIVYAVIGKLQSEVKKILTFREENKLEKHMTIVASSADDPAPVIYHTPFTAMSVAEHYAAAGKNVLVIFDDLTTHAKYYREIALLAKKFPGRDSYPGDIFHTHGRLLERAGCYVHPQDTAKTVSISALPLAETIDQELTDYIVSNLISITDGHLLFDADLFFAGNRPAINPGLSVTRVGKQTQTPVARELGQRVTSFLNRYAKLLSLTQFGAELNAETQAEIARGKALYSILKQDKSITVHPAQTLVLAGMTMAGWFSDVEPTHLGGVQQAVVSAPESVQNIIQTLAASASQKEFFQALETHKQTLTSLWQSSKT